MNERKKPTIQEVTFGRTTLTRTDSGSGWADYTLADVLHLQAHKNKGEIGGAWKTNKELGFFLGITNRQLERLKKDGAQSELFTGVIRSTLSELKPDSTDQLGFSMNIPFNAFDYDPPLTADNLVEAGHYTYDQNSQILKFLRLESPVGPFIYDLFTPHSPKVGALRLFDADSWEFTLKEMSELISETITIPAFNAEEVLRGMLKREYPRSPAST